MSGTTLGRVPILMADMEPPEEPAGSWWGRAACAVSGALTSIVTGLLG
jgi:hypothetical protein